ncbi:MAG: M48 family metalloprotease [Acidobacteriota bacterium]
MTSTPYQPFAGPADRVSFMEEQAGNRRATWRVGTLCLATVTALGMAFSAIVTPLLFMIGEFAYKFAGMFLPFPRFFDTAFDGLAHYLGQNEFYGEPAWTRAHYVGVTVLWIGPGVLALIVAWLFVRFLFFRVGIGGFLLTMGARSPRTDDLEEVQLVNIVTEMAIAAGVPPPSVMLIDSSLMNAASVGVSRNNSTVVISRRVLDELDRDETQGLLAYVIASIGNGDLNIGMMTMSLFQTFGLVMSFLDIPFSRAARLALWRTAKLAIKPLGPDTDAEAQVVTVMLASRMRPDALEEMNVFMEKALHPGLGTVGTIIGSLFLLAIMPWLLARLFGSLLLMLVMLFLLGPMLAASWRTRRFLADSTAVQLTRNPSGLARALVSLAERGDVIANAGVGDLMFVVGPEAGSGRGRRRMMDQIREVGERGDGGLAARSADVRQVVMEAAVRGDKSEENSFAEQQGIVGSFHPSLNSRISKLKKMGADVEWREVREYHFGPWLLGCAAFVVAVIVLVKSCG